LLGTGEQLLHDDEPVAACGRVSLGAGPDESHAIARRLAIRVLVRDGAQQHSRLHNGEATRGQAGQVRLHWTAVACEDMTPQRDHAEGLGEAAALQAIREGEERAPRDAGPAAS
jgi:hypothetical protein